MIFMILALFAAFLFYQMYWRRRKLPPGPIPYPLIGNIPEMYKYPEPSYDMFIAFKKKYGKIYSFTIANHDTVIVADWDLIKETFIKDGSSYVGRPMHPFSAYLRGGLYGITEVSGDRWQVHRRFLLQNLRDFGLGKGIMEQRILNEFQFLKDALLKKAKHDDPIDLHDHFDIAIGSIINSLLFSYRYDESRIDQFLLIKTTLTKHMSAAGDPIGLMMSNLHWAWYLPYFRGLFEEAKEDIKALFAILEDNIREHQESIDYESDECFDLTDAYLREMRKHENEPDFGGFEMAQLKSICFDLWIAGMETTSNTLYWAVLYILHHTEVAERIHAELDLNVASNRSVTMDDKANLHYLNAVINEVQRLANLLPMNLMHKTSREVVIDGYRLPADTIIIPQISVILYDEELFPEPLKFKPERHLDENDHLKKIEELTPFSIGKRSCLGEGLARMELFLFIANLYNQFEILPVDKANLPTTKKTWGITMCAQKFQVNLKPRFIEL